MQRYFGRTVLICEECKERLVLLADPELIWQSNTEGVECECGEELTLDNCVLEGDLSTKE